MRKRVSEIIAMSLLCACLALAGTTALAVAGLLGDGPTAQAQESGDDQQAGAGEGGDGEAEEHGCSPYPFDIMAIQALYQSVN